MTDRRQLIVVLPGIGVSVLARPGRPQDVVWDAGKGDIAGVVFRPARLSLDEAQHLDPVGLTESTKCRQRTRPAGNDRPGRAGGDGCDHRAPHGHRHRS